MVEEAPFRERPVGIEGVQPAEVVLGLESKAPVLQAGVEGGHVVLGRAIACRYRRFLCWLFLLAVRVSAGAEEPADATSPPHEYRFETYATSWSWDEGVHYGVDVPDLPASVQEGELRWRSLLRGNVGIRLALDAAGVRQKGAFIDLERPVGVRRGYVYADGNIAVPWKPVSFKFELGTVNNRFSLRNASLAVHEIPYAGTFRVGAFDAPMSLAMLSTSRATPLMELGMPVEALAPGSKAGFQFSNWVAPQRLTWAFGFFSEGDDADVGDASQTPASFIGRTTWRPWWRSEHEFLHVGLSASWAFSPSERIRFRSRPESFLAPYVVDTDDIDGEQATVGGLEAVWLRDRLSVQGEYLVARVFRDTDTDPTFGGLYLLGSLFLTPDARSYDAKSASFTSLIPTNPLSWRARQIGALELALRFSYVDLSDVQVRGGQAAEVMSGLNWYWNRYVRMQFNIGYAHVSGGPRPGDYTILQTRIDLQL